MRLILPSLLACSALLSPLQAQPPAREQSVNLPATPVAAPAQITAAEVGINERLGETVPLNLVFKDEDGKDVTLGSLLGKPTVLTLNYFRCAGICTPQLNGVVEVLSRAKIDPGKEFQVITVSFDPRDTFEMAATKRANYLKQIERPVLPAGWRFLTGSAEASRALADAVGFKFKQEGEDFLHAGALMILSPEGKVTRYMYGVTYLPADLELAVQEAAKGEVRPSISKWLKICFTTDPTGRRTVFSFTRTSAVVLILGAIVFGVIAARRGRKKTANTSEA